MIDLWSFLIILSSLFYFCLVHPYSQKNPKIRSPNTGQLAITEAGRCSKGEAVSHVIAFSFSLSFLQRILQVPPCCASLHLSLQHDNGLLISTGAFFIPPPTPTRPLLSLPRHKSKHFALCKCLNFIWSFCW